jgi:hypothetical protein
MKELMKLNIHYFLYPLFLVLLLVQTWRIQHIKANEAAAKKVFVHAISWAPACVYGEPDAERAAKIRYWNCLTPEQIAKVRLEYDQLSGN